MRFVMMMFLAVAVAEEVCTDDTCVQGSSMLATGLQRGPLSDLLARKGMKFKQEHADAMDPGDVSDESIAQLEEETRRERHAAEKALYAKQALLQKKRQEKAAEEAKIEAEEAKKKAVAEEQAEHEAEFIKAEEMVHHGRMGLLDDFEGSLRNFNKDRKTKMASSSLLQIDQHTDQHVWPFTPWKESAPQDVLFEESKPKKKIVEEKKPKTKTDEEISALEAQTKAEREEANKALKEKEELLLKKKETAAKIKLDKEKKEKAKKQAEDAKAKEQAEVEAVEKMMHAPRMTRLDEMEAQLETFNAKAAANAR